MTLQAGHRLGSYQIVGLLGAGGMGEVYRAKDTNLDRDVAIKVLPQSFALDADRVARFAREAKTLATLNHPNIAAIYGFEKTGDVTALVMELVEGEDLSQCIARGTFPIDEALPIAKQIADALETAHEQGIVHRDLKPANIKVRPDGAVKVLDFGLAKAITPEDRGATAGSNLANSPTFTSPAMTAMGILVGTAAYMAPEQARGKIVDKRADIWAFGAVVYEMLTQRRAFGGDEMADVLAAVLRQDVDWSALPPDTPPRLRRLLERCLDRDVNQRLRDIGEARIEIAKIENGAVDSGGSGRISSAAVGANTGRTRERIAWTIAAMAVIGVGALAFLRGPAPVESAQTVILPFVPPANVVPGDVSYVTVSPDGTKILFSAFARDGRKLLWVRPLDSSEATPLPDTDDGIEPFWSPDSKSVGFGSRGKLRRLDLGAGRAKVLGDATRLNNGAWSPADVIVFSPDFGRALLKVPATGGAAPSPATTLNAAAGDTGHRYPAFLQDGRHFLFRSDRGGKNAIIAASLDSKETKEIPVETTGGVRFVPPGFLIYIRNGTVVAHRFDPDNLELSGEPLAIAPASTEANYAQGARLSASNNGVLVIQNPVGYDYQLAMFDRGGNPTGMLGTMRTRVMVAEIPRISPDGKRVAVQRFDPREQNQDLWIGDLARGSFDRFTTNPAQEQAPLWTPDGRTLLTTTWRNANANGVYALPIGGGEDRLLLKGTVFPSDVSPDGKWLVFLQRGEATRSDIGVLPLSGGRAAGEPRAIVNSAANEMNATLSPDGKWLAYTSDLTGQDEIYVRSFAVDGTVGEAVRVTNGGADQPAWSKDGRELYYVEKSAGFGSARMMAVPVIAAAGALKFGGAELRFKASLFPRRTMVVRDYDVGPDGRFVIGTATVDSRMPPANVVLNWRH